jgi:TolB-like protein/Tfp pilus assembly protein PilF
MGALGTSDIFLFEHFRFDGRGLFRRAEDGRFAPLKIGSRAEDILRVLVERAGELVSKDEIIASVWPGIIVEESNLTVQMSTLRRFLDEPSAQGSYIQTVPGRGYRFVVKVARVDRDAPNSSPPPQRLSIVILPFADLSEDPDQQYFADGITEDLTTDLSRIPHSFVISRHTAFTYRNRSVSTKQIGRELGVRYVVEGSVRRSADHIRVTAQLVDADIDAQLWAERYDRRRADLFELQDEIVTAIAGAIEPELLKFERDRIAELPQQSEDAYELYQRGMFHHHRQNKGDNLKAQEYFRRALLTDPQSPPATAALSIALTIAAYLSWAEDPDRNYAEAFELGEQAVALDARYPNAHFALALICMWTGRTERAAAEFEEAIKLNPNFAAAHAVLGVVFTFLGKPAVGVASIEKGMRLSPRDPRLFIWLAGLAATQYQLGHYSQAVEIGRRSWALNRNYITGLTYVVAGLAQLGNIEEARTALAHLRAIDPKLAAARTTLQRLYKDQASINHLLSGLVKAGFEPAIESGSEGARPPRS